MDPYNRGSEEYGHDDGRGMGADWQDGAGPGSALERYQGGGLPAVPEDRARAAQSAVQGGQGAGARPGPARPSAAARTTRLVAGAYLLTVNPVDGSEIEPCPPGEHPGRPERSGPLEREERRAAAAPPAPVGPAAPARQRIVERGEERERLVRLLSRGRSVRVTGPSGSGRTALLDAVAADCAELAPDGLVRLSGHRRTAGDLLHELFAAVYHAPLHRPGPAELAAVVRDIGAVVVLDDIEFGGTALDELLAATPECAFLISATPEVAAPSADSHIEEVFLGGLGREACLEILEQAVERPLAEDEVAWASMLWFESEGLPLRFVQAGGLLRQRSVQGELVPGYETGYADPLPTIAEAAAPAALLASRLSPAARETLRFAVALGGACPHQTHLPALAGDTHADAAVGELLGCGLLTAAGSHYRLAAGAAFQLESAGYGEGADDRALTAAQHYAWWAGHPSVTAERVAAEADAMLAALAVLVGRGEAGEPAAAVLLARTAAPALAAAGAWGAWERALRYGQEAARLTGESAEEAYFHHELGILALCTGNLDRARAQLEAAISLRGALSDRHGAVAGRRALALVTDRAAGLVPGIPIAGAPSTAAPSAGAPSTAAPSA
ncbi:ATP-binding protein, partial [Streptomyces pathocidini]|uniref:ATP-binding protein n=1 Tax=Streptomyces pathocidini TaxID=1650571 RepID=UPI0033EA9635